MTTRHFLIRHGDHIGLLIATNILAYIAVSDYVASMALRAIPAFIYYGIGNLLGYDWAAQATRIVTWHLF